MFQVTSTWGWMFNVLFMLIAGICNCGPDAFVSGSIAAELGERENAQSAVSGFVNGKINNFAKLIVRGHSTERYHSAVLMVFPTQN